MRLVGGGDREALPATPLWRDPRRDESSERTLSSSAVSMRVFPKEQDLEEVTAFDGPNDARSTGETPTLPPPEHDQTASGLERPPRHRLTVIAAAVGLGALLFTPLILSSLDREQHADAGEPAPNELSSSSEREHQATLPEPLPEADELGGGDPCTRSDKPVVELSGEIETDATLHCDRNYLLRFQARVTEGATLTIEPGTTVLGDLETKGTLIVEPGARLIADGTRERPIVFTSSQAPERRRPGSWGGIVILGEAPINLRDAEGRPIRGRVEGLVSGGSYGGDDPEDDSGVLRHVRIEYPGVEIAPANELNGLTLAGVGRGTLLDYVQVRATTDDCFEFFGGTVDGKHLVCDDPGDDGFDFDFGYQGRLQFLVVRDHRGSSDPGDAGDGPSNAFEFDNDPAGAGVEPRTRPQIWNATSCGSTGVPSKHGPSYGMLVRRAASPELHAVLFAGFDFALDLRDAGTSLTLTDLGLIGLPGAESDERDDDNGFDELAWLADPARGLISDIEGFTGCSTPPPTGMRPAVPVPAAIAPPDDGFFDPEARWLGAFAGPEDHWADPAEAGAPSWIVW
ncbi:MAG: hypothetical protein KC457_19350 [Myxococcales bacterium]|nr:hypothetical protein [Myxococcales bacterium]